MTDNENVLYTIQVSYLSEVIPYKKDSTFSFTTCHLQKKKTDKNGISVNLRNQGNNMHTMPENQKSIPLVLYLL